VLGAVPENVTLIGMDFEQQCLEDVLQKAGYRESRKTFFIWEGVTQYLTPEAVDNTLRFITHNSGTGSAVVFTWVRRGIIDGTDRPQWLEKFLPLAEKMGSPWLFGLESVEIRQFLQERGLRLVEDIGFKEFQKRYLEQTERELSIFEGERTTIAEVIT
jgi:methyltransferase (TIGR00027 family)